MNSSFQGLLVCHFATLLFLKDLGWLLMAADTHIHAPQYPNSGLFGSSTLLDWLQTYTFPLEKSFGYPNSDTVPSQAALNYDKVVSRTLSHGTTCAAYYATTHIPAANYLSSLCHNRGQRALIGRVCMDREDICPDGYRDSSSDEAIDATKAMISHIQSIDPTGELVKPILTPRFAPACSEGCLAGLGALARAYNPPLHIQTHIAESKNEVSLVKELYPSVTSYADVYDQANLLTPRTILAHGIYFSPSERELIHARQSKVSHCPASNSALGSGICPVRVLLDSGITVGLGTDVSGGYSPSILEAVRQACLVSRLLRHTASYQRDAGEDDDDDEGRERLSVEEALYLATRGGAAVVDMADEIGGFDVGMTFDAQLVQLGSCSPNFIAKSENGIWAVSNVDLFGKESWTEKVHKWVWNGDDRNVKMVWVRGKLVHVREDVTNESEAEREGERED